MKIFELCGQVVGTYGFDVLHLEVKGEIFVVYFKELFRLFDLANRVRVIGYVDDDLILRGQMIFSTSDSSNDFNYFGENYFNDEYPESLLILEGYLFREGESNQVWIDSSEVIGINRSLSEVGLGYSSI